MVVALSQRVVLVHGAWHGSWCWHKVATNLTKMGHKVRTPDLPGHHRNPSPLKDVTLAKYVAHIEGIIREEPQPVVLVGHSMAGVVISQVAENIPDKIASLVYVSAFIPKNGGSLLDEEKQAAVPSVALEIAVNESEGLISLSASKRVRELFYNKCSDKDAEYALPRLQDQPLRPFIDPITISPQKFGTVPKRYIECLQDNAVMIQDQRRMHSRIKCEVVTLDTDHSPFFSADKQLAGIIADNNKKVTPQ